MWYSRQLRHVLLLSLSLVVISPATRAEVCPDRLALAISDAVPADSAAAHAAAAFGKTLGHHFIVPSRIQINNSGNFPTGGLVLAPLQQWQQRLPALTVLRLPFFYPNLAAVHNALDGALGRQLAKLAKQSGWKLLAVWDDGMTDFSGNQPYNKLPNLSGMQFALWHPDPLQAAELRALDTWSRVIRKNGVQRNAQQCIVDSRSTTPTQMRRERLPRVHLDLTLTHDRYVGYVLAIPLASWHRLPADRRKAMRRALGHITQRERQRAKHQQQQALTALHHSGMALHPLSTAQRHVFARRMPPWRDFLNHLDNKTVAALLAAARTAATGGRSGTHEKALADPLPATRHAE